MSASTGINCTFLVKSVLFYTGYLDDKRRVSVKLQSVLGAGIDAYFTGAPELQLDLDNDHDVGFFEPGKFYTATFERRKDM